VLGDLLLLHGFSQTGRSWAPVMAQLRERYRCFAPDLPGAEAALSVVVEAIEKAGYKPGKDVSLALDVASSELWDAKKKTYNLEGEGKELDGAGLVAFLGARLTPGAPLVVEASGLDSALAGARVVFTGEGRVDRQTAYGKGPAEVIRRAGRAGVPAVLIAGVFGFTKREFFDAEPEANEVPNVDLSLS